VVSSEGRADGVVAIVGTDTFLAEEVLEKLIQSAIADDRQEGLQVMRGEEQTWARVLDAARARSLFVARRAVIVRGAEALKGPDDDLAAYLSDPTPGVTLAFMAPKPDKRRTAWRTLLARARVLSAEPLKGQKLRARVMDEVRRRGLAIEPQGVEELVERVGQDLRRLMGELDKLEAFGAGRTLTAEDVAAVLGRGFARPFYLLGDALSERRTADLLALIQELMDDGEDAVRILGALHRSVRQLRAVRALQAQRATREQVAARIGLPPNMLFKLPAIADAARGWSEAELEAAVAAFGLADRRVKTGSAASVALVEAVAAVCRRRGGRATSAEPRGR
jgi:DNA polymerase III subunit delta